MSPLDLLRDFPHLAIRELATTTDRLCATAESTAPMAACPTCGLPSDHMHSRYTRTLADLPWQGRRLLLRITARRFRCRTPGCERVVFCERLPAITAHARTTARLADAHRLIGLAVGGEAGSRLADRLEMPTSPDTLLRRVKATADEAVPQPRVVGIDDWAWKRGHRYGTIVVDLERGRVIDLLPDRDAATVKVWLDAHPGVEVVSRDRWSAYAQAAAEAAPRAAQVADRWHLLKNLREAVERLFERHAAPIREALTAATPAAPAEPVPLPVAEPPPAPPTDSSEGPKVGRQVERYEQVRELHRLGRSVRRIARELGLTRNTVRRYLRMGIRPERRASRPRPTRLGGYAGWVDGRIAAGCTNATALHRELLGRGVRASISTVRRLVTARLAAAGVRRGRTGGGRPPTRPLPTPRQLSFEWVRRAEDRTIGERERLGAVRATSDAVAAALDLADGFAELIRKRSAGTLDDWLVRAESSGCPDLRRFAEGIRRDEPAVRAAVHSRWSNGQVEGQVGRLKLIKRAGYGRAGFALLRARVLHRV